MDKSITSTDQYFKQHGNWQEIKKQLREIILRFDLKEELKWRRPCYTFEGSNVMLMTGLKDYFALSFFRGALLKDKKGILQMPGENTQSGRLIKFTSVQGVVELEPVLKAYIKEAIGLHRAGLKVEFKKELEPFPAELQQKLEEEPAYKEAFEALTPGRKRGYILHFSAPKQPKTRVTRIEKAAKRILAGKGIHDCICGHTKRPPNCDGSHKFIQQD